MRLHWWHDWSEWVDVTKTTTWTDTKTKRQMSSTEVGKQERRCGVCGLLERKSVYGEYGY